MECMANITLWNNPHDQKIYFEITGENPTGKELCETLLNFIKLQLVGSPQEGSVVVCTNSIKN